ncbi:hypothetical protein MLD38_037662 [Melastoma candidum]|uniref:Uncharacterized protein n=1 Tax=Melastoma candidum TaxID=119954 RepID=A0ACB9LP50_9MYRT|nr:hypothetical protein MLD38_037662 [Melastoma candidum]
MAMLDRRMVTMMVSSCLFICSCTRTGAIPDVTVVGYDCIGEYDPLSDYQSAVEKVVRRLKRETHSHGYNYLTYDVTGNSKCFGQGICDSQLSGDECMYCLGAADVKLMIRCYFPVRALMILRECLLKYQEVIL